MTQNLYYSVLSLRMIWVIVNVEKVPWVFKRTANK